jgi:hypothetical protein
MLALHSKGLLVLKKNRINTAGFGVEISRRVLLKVNQK